MGRVYKDTPDNFIEIEPYIITDVAHASEIIICEKRCFFYDACSFRNHMQIKNVDCILNYIKNEAGIVIITRSIIMELCSSDGMLWEEHIQYIKSMAQQGIKVLVIYEEDVAHILSVCFNSVAKINEMLSVAVKVVKSKVGAIERVMNEDTALRKEIISDYNNSDILLSERFFKKIRMNKVTQDNMGEELIAVCIHMLSNICEADNFKYRVLTDDRGAITICGKVMQNVEKYMHWKSCSVISTIKLSWSMVKAKILTEKAQIVNLLEGVSHNGEVNVICSEEFELSPTEKKMNVEEYAEKLIGDKIKVYM